MTLHRTVAAAFTVVVLTAAAHVSAQVRRSSPEAATVPIAVDMTVGGAPYKETGTGRCTHAPVASLYDVRSQMWTARHEAGPSRSVQLTYWKPTDGSTEMFSVAAGSMQVSVAPKGSPSGSGTVKFEPSGKGGVFKVDVKTADGKPITGTIKCDAFTPHVAEGG